MNNLINIQEMLEAEVTRRQFLTQIGVALLAVVGIAGLMQNIQSVIPQKKDPREGAYGWSGYSE